MIVVLLASTGWGKEASILVTPHGALERRVVQALIRSSVDDMIHVSRGVKAVLMWVDVFRHWFDQNRFLVTQRHEASDTRDRRQFRMTDAQSHAA